MDGTPSTISPSELYARLGNASAPVVVDVRRPMDISTANELIIGAFHRSPEEVDRWKSDLPRDCQVVVYCAHGREVSQRVADTLRSSGIN